MKTSLAALLLVFCLAPMSLRAKDLETIDITGTWKTFIKDTVRPKTLGEVIFSLRMDSEGIKGGVLMGSFPGYATVTEGWIEGDRIFFSANGGRKAPNIRFRFEGTIRNGVLTLTILEDAPRRVFGDAGIRVEGQKLIGSSH